MLVHLQFLTVISVQRTDGIILAAVSHCFFSASISFAARVAPLGKDRKAVFWCIKYWREETILLTVNVAVDTI